MTDIKQNNQMAEVDDFSVDYTNNAEKTMINDITARDHILQALQKSMAENDELYQKLAQ